VSVADDGGIIAAGPEAGCNVDIAGPGIGCPSVVGLLCPLGSNQNGTFWFDVDDPAKLTGGAAYGNQVGADACNTALCVWSATGTFSP